MKKVLLTLLTLFVAGGAWAQVEETDLSAYKDVMYAQSTTVLAGTTSVRLPINVKSHADFTATESMLVLPEGVTVLKDDGVNPGRYDASQDVKLVSFMGNKQDAGYKLASVIASQGIGDDAETTYGFTAGDDALGYILIDVSSLAVGEYALIMKDATISGFFDGSADVTLSEEIVTKLVVTDRVVLKETSTEVPSAYENVNVTVNRIIKAGQWSTLCLPFDMTAEQVKKAFGDDVELAYFDETNTPVTVEKDGNDIVGITVTFTADDLSAGFFGNYPYVIKVSKDIESFEVDGVKINPDQTNAKVSYSTGNARTGIHTYSFYGTLSAGTIIPEDGLFISDNKFWYSNGSTAIKGFRAYFQFTDVLTNKSASAKININVDSEATSINRIDQQNIVDGVYDLSGRKIQLEGNDLNKLQKGVYIIDGKKVTIK